MSGPKVSTPSRPGTGSANDRIEALEMRLSELERFVGVRTTAGEFHGTLDTWNGLVRDAIMDLQQRAGVPPNQMIDPPEAEHLVPPPPPPFGDK